MLQFWHGVAARVTIAELALSDEEATELARAGKSVLDEYDVPISPKALAWTNLIGACTTIYGTRLLAYKLRKNADARETPDNVVKFGP